MKDRSHDHMDHHVLKAEDTFSQTCKDHSGQQKKAHHHVHSPEEKKTVVNRLSRALGHLEKVIQMVEADEDCSDVLVQIAAVRNAINNTGKLILKNHLEHCIVHAIEDDDLDQIKVFNDAIDTFIK